MERLYINTRPAQGDGKKWEKGVWEKVGTFKHPEGKKMFPPLTQLGQFLSSLYLNRENIRKGGKRFLLAQQHKQHEHHQLTSSFCQTSFHWTTSLAFHYPSLYLLTCSVDHSGYKSIRKSNRNGVDHSSVFTCSAKTSKCRWWIFSRTQAGNFLQWFAQILRINGV